MIEEILKISRTVGANTEQYGLWGKIASKRFLEEGTLLNDTVQKIASVESLNGNEITRVCQAANLETYAYKLKQANPHDKSFEFPLADASKILSDGPEKTAMPALFLTDFDRPLDRDLTRVAGGDIFEAFGVEPMEKTAQDGARAEALLEKMTRLAELEKDKIAAGLEKSVDDAEKFYQHIKQEVLKGKSFEDVRKAVLAKASKKEKVYSDRIMELTAYVKRRMYDSGLLQHPAKNGESPDDPTRDKTAEPVEACLITDTFESPGVTVSVINGRHPMFATIDTLVQQFEEADKGRHNLIILEDKIRYTKNRVYGKNQPL